MVFFVFDFDVNGEDIVRIIVIDKYFLNYVVLIVGGLFFWFRCKCCFDVRR